MNNASRVCLCLTLTAFLLPVAHADFELDPKFQLGDALQNADSIEAYRAASVKTLARSRDGKTLYLGGSFNRYGVKAIGRDIVSLREDGSLNTHFDTGEGIASRPENLGLVESIVADPLSDKIYVGGGFQKYRASDAPSVMRLNADGSRDTAFDVVLGATDVTSLTVDPVSGKLYVLGGFQKFDGLSVPGIVRLNRNGTLDTSFSFDSELIAAQAAPRSTYLMAFTRKLLLSRSGQLYISYMIVDGLYRDRNCVARLSPDGKWDRTFETHTFDRGRVYDMLEDKDGSLLIAGDFGLETGETTVWYLVKLSRTGKYDPSFQLEQKKLSLGTLFSLLQPTGWKDFLLGGGGSYATDSLTRIDPTGQLVHSSAEARSIRQIVEGRAGEFYVAGTFQTYKTAKANGLIRLKYIP